MERDLNNKVIGVLKDKIPERGKLTTVLTELLNLEKESVYRRLRNEVPFTFAEIAKVALHFELSVDNIITAGSLKVRPFQLKMVQFLNPQEEDYQMLEHFVNALRIISRSPESELGSALNILPQSLSLIFPHIYNFYLFKWMYQYGAPSSKMNYADIEPTARLKKINKEIVSTTHHFAHSYYIWDRMIFRYLVNDILYFANIKLLSKVEVEELKTEILQFIDYVEELAVCGEYAPGHKVWFYVSSINFESSYSYFGTPDHCFSMVKMFTLNDAISYDEKIHKRLKYWMYALKRTSTLISESGEMQRILFFQRQREIVNEL
ncbi:MAG: hypothetical protein LUE93_12305 [Bacteroides sp.]|nr:hypothetical protein [Bacteroides sp.]